MEGNAGTRARGVVTLKYRTEWSNSILFPILLSDSTGKLVFQTECPALLPPEGFDSLSVEINAVEPGQQYNLPAGSITMMVNNLDVFSEVIQDEAMQGGADYSVEVLSVSAEAQKNIKTATKEIGADLDRVEADLERLKKLYEKPNHALPVLTGTETGRCSTAKPNMIEIDNDDARVRTGPGRDDRPDYVPRGFGYSPPPQYEVSGVIEPGQVEGVKIGVVVPEEKTVEQEQEALIAQIKNRMERGE